MSRFGAEVGERGKDPASSINACMGDVLQHDRVTQIEREINRFSTTPTTTSSSMSRTIEIKKLTT